MKKISMDDNNSDNSSQTLLSLNASEANFESNCEKENFLEDLEIISDEFLGHCELENEENVDGLHANTPVQRIEVGTQTFEPLPPFNFIDLIVNQGPERQATIRLIVSVVQYMFTQQHMLRLIVAIVRNEIGQARAQEDPIDRANNWQRVFLYLRYLRDFFLLFFIFYSFLVYF